jgi:glutathione synthase/RimK-type ligase-like ATP-grasp enzyme
VHTIGATLFATAIHTQAVDYPYAHRHGEDAEFAALEIPDAIAERCLSLAQALGLTFAGIDLTLTPDHQACCLEVNPSPAFGYYEAHTGQPIAQAAAR